jgi:hypothetical protein
LHDILVATAGSEVQGRSAPVVFARDQTWIPGEELLDLRDVTLLCRIVDVAAERGKTANQREEDYGEPAEEEMNVRRGSQLP